MNPVAIFVSALLAVIPILSLNTYFLWGGNSSLWISIPISVIGIVAFLIFIFVCIAVHELLLLVMQCLFWADLIYVIYRGKFFLLAENTAYIVVASAALLFVVVLPLIATASEWKEEYIKLKKENDLAKSKLKSYEEKDRKRATIRDALRESLRR